MVYHADYPQGNRNDPDPSHEPTMSSFDVEITVSVTVAARDAEHAEHQGRIIEKGLLTFLSTEKRVNITGEPFAQLELLK